MSNLDVSDSKVVPLFIYSKAEYVHATLRSKRIKLSRLHELNDPFEVYGVYRRSKYFAARFESFRADFARDYGLICMTENDWSPVMWAHYADRHHGVCYRFDVRESHLWKVSYKSELHSPDELKRCPPMEQLRRLISTKSSEWRYEREHRVVIPLRDAIPEDSLFFQSFSADFQLREVRLGMACELAIEDVRSIVAVSYADKKVIVSKAKTSSTSFRVIEDRSVRDS
jgi:hypothetical protein